MAQPPSELDAFVRALLTSVVQPAGFALVVAGVLTMLFVQAMSRVRR